MYVSKIKNPYRKYRKIRICQGDIYKDLKITVGMEAGDTVGAKTVYMPYSVIATQDCDLEQDYTLRLKDNPKNYDKEMINLLVCPAWSAEDFFMGTHLKNIDRRVFGTREKDKVMGHKEDRYHYLKMPEETGIPNLVIDFKLYTTIPTEVLYIHRKELYKTTLNELFRERFTQRFTNYLSRIALPEVR